MAFSDAEMDDARRVKFARPEIVNGDLIYDPDQNPDEKRKLRKGYRTLNKHNEGNTNANEITTQQLSDRLEQADNLFSQVRGPQEAMLDSTFLVKASQMGAMKARALKSGPSAFDADDFVAKLVTFMGGRRFVMEGNDTDDNSEVIDIEDEITPLQWDKIGRKALAKSRRVPVMDFMLGPLSIEQKKRANNAKRAKLEKNEQDKSKPQDIREEDISRSENETTAVVASIRRLLDATGEINLFKFIVNPDDFGQSVENLFYLSFLIRDGACALDMREGEPIIYTCEEPTQEDRAAGLRKQQIVMEFDMATWERAIEVFHIARPFIPQRIVRDTSFNTGKTWYG